eukprot:1194846-Prorocentrum_minimum.AAC.10
MLGVVFSRRPGLRGRAGRFGLMVRRSIRKYLGGELNSPVVEWLNRGLMDHSQLGRVFGVR